MRHVCIQSFLKLFWVGYGICTPYTELVGRITQNLWAMFALAGQRLCRPHSYFHRSMFWNRTKDTPDDTPAKRWTLLWQLKTVWRYISLALKIMRIVIAEIHGFIIHIIILTCKNDYWKQPVIASTPGDYTRLVPQNVQNHTGQIKTIFKKKMQVLNLQVFH